MVGVVVAVQVVAVVVVVVVVTGRGRRQRGIQHTAATTTKEEVKIKN